MMEAEEYFSTYDALHKGESAVRRLEIRLRNVSNIAKVVWSSFDFMCGPELKFVWEVIPSNSVSPLNLSSGEGSINGEGSLVSSMSTQSAQYEDIDDPLQTNLTSVGELYDSMFVDDYLYHDYCLLNRGSGNTAEELYLDELMQDSHCSASDSNSTLTNSIIQEDMHAAKSVSSTVTLSLMHITEQLVQTDEAGDSTAAINPVIGTPTKFLDKSISPSNYPIPQVYEDNLEMGKTSGNSMVAPRNTCISPFTKTSDNERVTEQVDEREEQPFEKLANALTTSCVDSGIGGTISTHSELSGFCLSPLAESLPDAPTTSFQPFKDPKLTSESYRGSVHDDDISVLDLPINVPDHISDEVFVTKFVLAEQVFSAQLPSNPLMHKMTVVPSRNLLVGSFIFSMSQPDGIRTLYAISFLMNNCKLEWYMERQTFVESVVLDIIPKLKASIMAEPWEDVVVRANLDLTRMVNLISILDRYPLVSELCPLLIKNTLLVQKRCQDDKILSKAISGVLQSQGQCVIIGSDTQYVCRLLHTLAAFLPIELRWCCPRMYRHKFSPYVRLQAVHRHELPNVMQCGALANWPLCVVDVDRSMVCMSAHYSRHRVLKQRADAQRIDTILNNVFQNKPVTLELSSCRILECVKAFVRRMDMLPVEQSARMGLVNQLLLYVENMAQALIVYVKHASEPLPSEKSSATKSSRFSLNECRCALDLQSDSWFHAVLARAELIMPDIAEFIYSST